ncbi:nuclear protein MDM1 isoform X2 [Halichoeres trimaculatus]|uniref:nuclear protein MDM1 isoform X2 n=1 Tax=Halichoeres trimaculatus TaxID=147232 RepID=UPI003D9F39BB
MTVRFKCQSEYQKSYRSSRSRSVSPQRSAPFAGLRSDQMGIVREPCLQRRKKLDPGGLAKSCSSLIFPPEPRITAPPAASKSHSANRKESPKPPSPPSAGADCETPVGPRPSADPEPPAEPEVAEKSVQPHPSKPDDQSQLSRPPTAAPDSQLPSSNEVQHALRWKAGLRPGGQRSGVHRSEYSRQFSWKKPTTSASPLLTAEQVLYSSSRSVPPFKKHPVTVETEYNRSYKGAVPPTGPRLRKHLEQQRIPLFHTHMVNKKRKEESEKKPRPVDKVSSPVKDADTPPPSQVQRGHRIATEYESSFRSPLHRIPEEGGARDGDAPQVTELRQKALSYRQRAWGTHFPRDHLSQLLSDHNALWEPTDTTSDSAADPPSPRPTSDPCPDPDSRSTSHVEALELPSHSSKRSSVVEENMSRNTQNKAGTPPSPASERRTAWGEEEGEEEKTDEEEGRLPTPRLKLLPVQRTHHDLTTPATGGAILVGKLRSSGGSSPNKQRSSSAVSMAEGAEPAPPSKPKEAWSNNSHSQHSPAAPSPPHKAAGSPPSKPIRMKQTNPSPVAPPPLVPPPLHGFQGTLRHPDFQHNGELGLRFREAPCPGGGCGSDEDDRLSVMSWRSAASCSMASAVLERAQKRRESFWGKR